MGIDDVRARIASIQSQFPSRAPGPSLRSVPAAGRLAAADRSALSSGAGAGGFGSAAFGAQGTGADFASMLSRYQAAPGTAGTAGAATGNPRLDQFLRLTTDQRGDAYVWGSETTPDQADPTSFDCSELVQWAAARVGVEVPDGSWFQYLDLKNKGMTIPVEQALRTPGALLFSFGSEPVPGGPRPAGAHVAISLGDGRTIEARGRKWGVGTWEAGSRFEYAALIPGLEPRR